MDIKEIMKENKVFLDHWEETDDDGRVIYIKDSKGLEVEYKYDDKGRKIEEQDNFGFIAKYKYKDGLIEEISLYNQNTGEKKIERRKYENKHLIEKITYINDIVAYTEQFKYENDVIIYSNKDGSEEWYEYADNGEIINTLKCTNKNVWYLNDKKLLNKDESINPIREKLMCMGNLEKVLMRLEEVKIMKRIGLKPDEIEGYLWSKSIGELTLIEEEIIKILKERRE
jgi:YD repeat-containing protein